MTEYNSLGFVGVGAMGGALVRRIAASGKLSPGKIVIADKRQAEAGALARELGVGYLSVKDVPANAQGIILAVKPQNVEQVLAEMRPCLEPHHLIISVAAGVSLGELATWTTPQQPIVRVMPNTPCLVGAGAIVCSPNQYVDGDQLQFTQGILETTGRVWIAAEAQMGAVTGVSGSGPAYVFLFLEALIEGGVAAGLGYPLATDLALQTLLGAARLAMETGQHPAALRNMVTSPAGTTIAALRKLEAGGLRSTLIEAVLAASAGPRGFGADRSGGVGH